MKCLILAAGYATRLYPLTKNFPKPLLKIKDKAILDWLIDDIKTSGAIDEYVVITNHKFAAHFLDWAAGRPDDKITVVDDGTVTNETRLGAVRDIQFAIDSLGIDDDMLVIAGDSAGHRRGHHPARRCDAGGAGGTQHVRALRQRQHAARVLPAGRYAAADAERGAEPAPEAAAGQGLRPV